VVLTTLKDRATALGYGGKLSPGFYRKVAKEVPLARQEGDGKKKTKLWEVSGALDDAIHRYFQQTVKVFEFKLDLTQAQQQLLDSWLDTCLDVYNLARYLLSQEHQHRWYSWFEKKAKALKISTEGVERRYLRFGKRSPWGNATCTIARIDKKTGRYCPLGKPNLLPEKPPLKGNDTVALTKEVTRGRYGEKFLGIPWVYVKGELDHAATGWQAFVKQPGRAILKYKNRDSGDKISSLTCAQSNEIEFLSTGHIKLPGVRQLGLLKIVNSNKNVKRLPSNPDLRVARIVKEPSGYYLHLSVRLEKEKLPPSNLSCGIDVGLAYFYSDDIGRRKFPERVKKSRKKINPSSKKIGAATGRVC